MRKTPLPVSRRRLTTAIIASLLATITVASAALAIGNLQNGAGMPVVSLDPTHARPGDSIKVAVSDIPDTQAGYQVYLISTQAIEDDENRTAGCPTHQHENVVPWHLGTTNAVETETGTQHVAIGHIPQGANGLPQGKYHPCVTWIQDDLLKHWAAVATLSLIGAIHFQSNEDGETVEATITGGRPNSSFTLYRYDRAADGEVCAGGLVIAEGTTQPNGNAELTISPLDTGVAIGEQICAGLPDGTLMAYGTMADLPGGVFLDLRPSQGPRGTAVTLTARQIWPPAAEEVTTYVETTPPPTVGPCNTTPPTSGTPRHLGNVRIQDNGLVTSEFTTGAAWSSGENTICIRWLTPDGNPGNIQIMPPLTAKFLITGTTTANSANNPSPPGQAIPISNSDLPPGSRLTSMQWLEQTYPVDTFSSPTGATIVPPIAMHVDPEGMETPLTRTITLHWTTPDEQRLTSTAVLHLMPVTIKVDGPNNSAQPFTVSLTGFETERPMTVNNCQQYGNQMPRRVMATGTTASVQVTPSTQDTTRLRRGVNRLCIEITDWRDHGYDKHYHDGVHPAVATFTYRVDTALILPESAVAGTAINATIMDLPPGATIRSLIIDGTSVQEGAAFVGTTAATDVDATAADQFGTATIRFIVPTKVGNKSITNKTVVIQAVYRSGETSITATGRMKILPTTPEALDTLQPPGQLAGIPYLTFRPRSAIVGENIIVRTRNLVPMDSTLQALKLNRTLVFGTEREESISTTSPNYVNVTVNETFGRQTVEFTVPAKIGENATANQIHIELHWNPGEENTDPYGNELIVVRRTIQLFTEDEVVNTTECSYLAQLEPGEAKAGAPLRRLRLKVATGPFNQPIQCPEPSTAPGSNTIPQGDITIRLQGDFPTEQSGPFRDVENARVFIRVIDASVQKTSHDSSAHEHAAAAPTVNPPELMTIRTPEATSVTLLPGTLIRGDWSYKVIKPDDGFDDCTEVPGNDPITLRNLQHGTEYELQVYNRPGCQANNLSGNISFTTSSGTRTLTVEQDTDGLEVVRRGDALTIQIPGCEEWIQQGATGEATYDACHIRSPRYIEFMIEIPGLTMPNQATRDADEQVIFTIEWEHHGLADQRYVYAYTQTEQAFPNAADATDAETEEEPSNDSLKNQQTTFHRFGENIQISAHGHVQYTDVEIHTAHDDGAVDQRDGDSTSSGGFQGCNQLLSSGVHIPAAIVFAGEREAAASINTANGQYSRVGLYHACARGGGGITTSDEADGYYRAKFVVAMSAELDKKNPTPSAGQVIRIQIHGYEGVNQDGTTVEEPVVISDIAIGGRRLAGPTDSRPTTWQNWKQENEFLYVMIPPEIQGSTSIRLWANSPENSIDQTCTAVTNRASDLANIFDAACRHTFTFTVEPPQLTIIQPGNELRINQEAIARVSGLPGNQICHATMGPLPITLLNDGGSPTKCVELQPSGQDSLFRFVMRIPEDTSQTRIVRYYVLTSGESESARAQSLEGESRLTVITDLNARATTEITPIPPTVSLLNVGVVRRLDKLTLRGRDFPRSRGSEFPIEITIGDCDQRCKNRRTSSVRTWEFDHILRQQPKPPGENLPMMVRLAGVEIPIEGEVETPTISMTMNPESGKAEDAVTVTTQGLEAYHAGYSVHIMTADGPGPPLKFQNPPQTDGRGEFNVKGIIPWWEHEGGTAEYPVRMQLFNGQKEQVKDAEFMFQYTNQGAPATPRPTPPTTVQPLLVAVPATPRPTHPGFVPTETPPPPTPTPTANLELPTATPQPQPTATPPSAQPIRSLAELIQAQEPTPTPSGSPTPTPEPLTLIGQHPEPEDAAEQPQPGISPWLYIAGGVVLLLLVAAVGIAVLIWKKPQDATVTPMGRVSGDDTPAQRPTIITGQGYLNSPDTAPPEYSPPDSSVQPDQDDPTDDLDPQDQQQ